jgi:hypothetical protein
MTKAAADIGRAAHLPEEPGQAFGARGALGRQQGAELLGEIDDSKTRTGLGSERSSKAGILEFGLTATKPLPNWAPSPILTGQASYSAPRWPSARSSSSMTVTFTPLGVARE